MSSDPQFGSFGRLTATTGTLTNRFQYGGREFDAESGFPAPVYYASLSRFISEDSSGFDGGANFYGWAKNNPVLWIDPLPDLFGTDRVCSDRHRVPRVPLTADGSLAFDLGFENFQIHQGDDSSSGDCIVLDPAEYQRFLRFYRDNPGAQEFDENGLFVFIVVTLGLHTASTAATVVPPSDVQEEVRRILDLCGQARACRRGNCFRTIRSPQKRRWSSR